MPVKVGANMLTQHVFDCLLCRLEFVDALCRFERCLSKHAALAFQCEVFEVHATQHLGIVGIHSPAIVLVIDFLFRVLLVIVNLCFFFCSLLELHTHCRGNEQLFKMMNNGTFQCS